MTVSAISPGPQVYQPDPLFQQRVQTNQAAAVLDADRDGDTDKPGAPDLNDRGRAVNIKA